MESRKIVILHSEEQRKFEIETTAETLSELKTTLSASGIDYTNMTFYEGLTKTELKSNGSLLPKDVMYKGNVTNELVIMLTKTNKKIQSGAIDRKVLYAVIKDNNLEAAIKAHFNKNYTNVNSDALEAFIYNNVSILTDPTDKKTEATDPIKELFDKCEKIKQALSCLINELEVEDVIDLDAVDFIRDVLETPHAETKYSEQELKEMFDFV